MILGLAVAWVIPFFLLAGGPILLGAMIRVWASGREADVARMRHEEMEEGREDEWEDTDEDDE